MNLNKLIQIHKRSIVMKCLILSLVAFIMLNSYSLSQSGFSKQGITTTDSLPVIYIPGIMGSPLYNDLNDDNKLEQFIG